MLEQTSSNRLDCPVALFKVIFEDKEKYELELQDLKELFYKLDLLFDQIIKIKTNNFFITF